MANKEKLFSEFQAPTKQEWLDKIEVDLKGADFQKRLVWRTNEGFNVQPFYRREDLKDLKTPDALPGEFPFVRGNKKNTNEWYVRQNIAVGDDPVAANKKALDAKDKAYTSFFSKHGKDLGFDPGYLDELRSMSRDDRLMAFDLMTSQPGQRLGSLQYMNQQANLFSGNRGTGAGGDSRSRM